MRKNIRKISLPEGEIIPIKVDFMFTSIFNNPKNKEILESFIACYLDIPFEKVHNNIKIISRKLSLENKKEQSNEVDLLLKYDNKVINIEMSTSMSEGIKDRNVVFASKVHGKNLNYSEKEYEKISKTIQINLVAHNINKNKFIESYYLKNEEGEKLTEKLQIDYIDMVKASKMCYNEGTREENLRKWCLLFMENKKEEFERMLKEWDIMSEKAKKNLQRDVRNLSEEEDYIIVYETLEQRRENEHRSVMLEQKKKMEEIEKKMEEEYKKKMEEEYKKKMEDIEKKVQKETEKMQKETEKMQKETEKMQKETEKMQKETEKMQKETEEIKKELDNSKYEIAKKLLNKDIDIKIISETTGLDIDQIEKLR